MDRLPFNRPDVGDEEISAVVEAIRSGWITSGPEMKAFETDFADHVGGDVQAIAVNSATAGLHLALEACGIGPGDEVIVPTWTFTASAEVVRYMGASPVLVDIDVNTLNIDLAGVADAMTARTKAVIPVHMAGLGVDTAALRRLVGPDIRIIEDAAHALPTITDDVMVGSCLHTDAAVFSFYATKTITTGEGGMVTTRDEQIAQRIRVMRLHGIDRDAFSRYSAASSGWAYDVIAPGYKYNLTDPAAAMGRVQLRRSNDLHARRSEIACEYLEGLSDLPLQMPALAPTADTHAWHLFIIRLTDEAPLDRDSFIHAMGEAGIGTSVHFIPLHRLTYWRTSLDVAQGQFPAADQAFERVVTLPLFTSMTEADIERVTSTAAHLLRP